MAVASSAGVWAGVSMAFLGNTAINFGTNLIKFSHQLKESIASNEQSEQSLQKKYWIQRSLHESSPRSIWISGFTLFVLGSVLNFVAFGFAAQSLLASLGSIQFITNVAFSALVLGATISRRVILATLSIVLGNILIVIFAKQGVSKQGGDDLMMLYTQFAYIWYLISIAVGSFFMQAVFMYIRAKHEGVRIRNRFPFNLLNHLPAIPLLSKIHLSQPVEKKVSGLAYAISSAMIGTQSVVLAKSCSELLRTTISGSNQFDHPFTYVVLAAWILTITFWLNRLNKALVMFDGVFIIPVLQVVWILFSVLAGGIYFQEFFAFTSLDAKMFVLGILIILGGVYLLTSDPTISNSGSGVKNNTSSDWTDVLMNVHFEISADMENSPHLRSMSDTDFNTPTSLRSLHTDFSKSAPNLFASPSHSSEQDDIEGPILSNRLSES